MDCTVRSFCGFLSGREVPEDGAIGSTFGVLKGRAGKARTAPYQEPAWRRRRSLFGVDAGGERSWRGSWSRAAAGRQSALSMEKAHPADALVPVVPSGALALGLGCSAVVRSMSTCHVHVVCHSSCACVSCVCTYVCRRAHVAARRLTFEGRARARRRHARRIADSSPQQAAAATDCHRLQQLLRTKKKIQRTHTGHRYILSDVTYHSARS
jgi:hypothetical protein